jgi:DNA-binding IclR family transcriptional regulator
MVRLRALIERRDLHARRHLVRRVQSEFVEMPGLTLTLEQAGRLLALDEPACQRILNELVRGGFLRQCSNGAYGRLELGP